MRCSAVISASPIRALPHSEAIRRPARRPCYTAVQAPGTRLGGVYDYPLPKRRKVGHLDERPSAEWLT